MTKYINNTFRFNVDYIASHLLADELVEKLVNDGYELIENEIFAQIPDWEDYFISQYGTVVSIKDLEHPRVLAQAHGGNDKEDMYLYINLSSPKRKNHTISIHRAVANVFCPNFWGGVKLEAHHCDRHRRNNYYKNIILLPINLHHELHSIKRLVLFKDGQMIDVKNPLDLVYEYGLTLEQIILHKNGKKAKRIKNDKGFEIYEIDGVMLGYQYHRGYVKSSAKRKKRKK